MPKTPKQREHYIINYYGELIEVDREIYTYHYGEQRRCRYQLEKIWSHGYHMISLEQYVERGFDISDENPYDLTCCRRSVADQVDNNMQISMLLECVSKLSREEQKLIQALFYEEKSERAYAKQMGLSHGTIGKRKKKVLAKLKNMMLEV